MEGMVLFISIIFIVFCILQIILFFKVWGMTNDVNRIKELLLSKYTVETQATIVSNNNDSDIQKDLLVVDLKTENQMRVGEKLDNGKYRCYSFGQYVGDFAPSEFMEFEKWVVEVYRK